MYSEVNRVSNIIKEFSRFAHKYDRYNMIQAKVAATLVEMLPFTAYKRVIDIGCGSGEVFKNFERQHISVEHFVALDSVQTMLDIHPSSLCISKVRRNFNEENFLSEVSHENIDLIISSSALQWSQDLDLTLQSISPVSQTFHAAVFTSGTFETLHKTAGVESPIYNAEIIQEMILKYYNTVTFNLHEYSLKFKTTRDMFKYIKQSGVSSGERKLTYKETKQLMETYPLDYLEFEVLFIEACH